MMWMVIWFVIGTHEPSSLPPSRNLTYAEANNIAHADCNYSLGIYGVVQREQNQ